MTRHYSVIGIVVSLATYALHVLGLFVVPNGLAYDLWLHARPIPVESVLVVEVPPWAQERGDGIWGDMAETLRDFGARQLVFTFNPFTTESSTPPGLAGDDLIVGRFARPDGRGGWEFLEPEPPSGTAWGANTLPPAEYGIHRRLKASITVDGATVPSLPVLAATKAGVSDAPLPDAHVLLRFPDSADRIPRVEFGRVLEGEVVRDLVEGRVVVVGPLAEPAAVGLTTPMAPGSPSTLTLDFTAVAIETMLSGRWVRDMGPGPVALLLLSVTLLGALLYARLSPRRWPWAMGGALATVALAAAALIEAGDILIPVGEILFAQILASILVWHSREAKQDRLLRSLLRQFPSEEQRAKPPEATEPGDWRLLGAMTRRLLGLRRSLLLVPGKRPSRLEQVAALGCSLADVKADQRDPRRSPYLDATRAGEPIQVPPSFLACADESELIYLASLRRDDAVAGYWAFTLAPEEASKAPELLRALQAAADLLAEERAPAELRLDSPTRAVDALLRARLGSLSRRSRMLDDILDQVSTALVVFDRIGRVLHANSRLSALAEAIGIHPAALTPSDLMIALCGLPEEDSARLTRRVLLEGAGLELPALVEVKGRRYFLRFSPLRPSQGGGLPDGIVCEALDVSDLVRLAQFQRTFVQHVGLQLRHDVATIQMAAALMADDRLPKETGRRSWAHLQAAIERLLERLTRVENYLEEEAETRAAVALPVDPLLALKAALGMVGEAADQKDVRLEPQRSSVAGLVVADPLELRNILGALMRLLVGDARRGTEVAVTFEERADEVELILQNDGLGMPDARLKAILSGEEPQSAELRDLREGARAVEHWGGRLDGEGRPGVGFRFALTMPRFK